MKKFYLFSFCLLLASSLAAYSSLFNDFAQEDFESHFLGNTSQEEVLFTTQNAFDDFDLLNGSTPKTIPNSDKQFDLIPISTYATGIFDEGAAEIVTYDPGSAQAFFTNANANTVTILSLRNPAYPRKVKDIALSSFGGGVNSVAVANGIVAVAVEAETVDANGKVVFFDTNGEYLNDVEVGVLPDMVTFTPDGTRALTANEGQPSDDYTVDPEGSVSIIDISTGVANASVTNVDFRLFNGQEEALRSQGIRIFGPGASAAQDFEPEYIAITEDGLTAIVVLQENNAIVGINIVTGTINDILPLGFKDHNVAGNGIDASNETSDINICNWPVLGMYQPDAIQAVNIDGVDYFVTANEGDARDYDGFSEETRVGDLTLDPTAYPNADSIQVDENLGRLRTTDAFGDTDSDGDIDQIYSYGARSFTIWDGNGNVIFDSGDHFEQTIAAVDPTNFNSNNDDNDSFKARSDDKGPEPEAVEIVKLDGSVFALIGLERMGGVMVYDISTPAAPTFVSYVNNRDFSADADTPEAGDLGVEDIQFIAAADSPTGTPLVLTANEVSGTVTVFAVNEAPTISAIVSEVFLDGTQDNIRSVETNQGNLIADAFVYLAERELGSLELDANIPVIAIENGGGVRNDNVIAPGNLTNDDILSMLDRNNTVVVSNLVTPQQLKLILENAVSRAPSSASRFAQIGGFKMVYDPTAPAQESQSGTILFDGERVLDVTLNDGTPIIKDGSIVENAPSVYIATNSFVGDGRDGYVAFDDIGINDTGIDDEAAVFDYIGAVLNDTISVAQYPEGGEGRIKQGNSVIQDSEKAFELIPISTFATGIFDESAAEIVAYDKESAQVFFTNADANTVTILNIQNPYNPRKVKDIELDQFGGGVNSVAVMNEIVAVALEGEAFNANGKVVFFDTDGNYLNDVTVGVLPDMVTFTPDGTKVLTANEGEPNDEYTEDPEGSVSIINIVNGVENAQVVTTTFNAFDGQEETLRSQGIRIFGPGASASQDFEPEYIAVTENSQTAYVVLQENNAIATLNIDQGTISAVLPLGYKDHNLAGNGIDASNRSEGINICQWNTLGMYQPDAIASVNIKGVDYLVSANEGDARDYDGFSEEERVRGLTLDPTAYPFASTLQRDERLGRLNSTTATGDTDGDGDIDQIYSYGTRSFSIWGPAGALIFDSGDHIEQKLAELLPNNFNSTNDDNDSFKNRSDDKGPEPEAVEIAKMGEDIFALIGLERVGGVMVYDITDPFSPAYVSYVNNRNFDVDAESPEAGDLGVEDIKFLSPAHSPTGTPLVITANEVSGTISIFAVNELPEAPIVVAESDKDFDLTPIGTFATGIYDEGAAEIVAHDPISQRAFFTNADANTVSVLDIKNPFAPVQINDIDMSAYGAGVNSVTVNNEIVAVAVEAEAIDAPGAVVFFDTDGNLLNNVTVGVLPDMVTFTPDGTKAIVANEGEPNDEYTIDPEGSVSIIDISGGVEAASVTNLTFEQFNGQEEALRAQGVRIFGPGASAAQDFEPEYIAVTEDGTKAFAVLQENNAIISIDLTGDSIMSIFPLGFKDHSIPGNGFDASNRSDSIDIRTWPTLGMYQPDAMKSINIGGADYIVTANEGDARDYDGFSEEERVGGLTLDSTAYPNAAMLQMEAELGRLNSTTATGDTDGDGDIDQIYSYGARSFSIWAADGTLVFDSGDFIEQKIAELTPTVFNSTNDDNDSFKNRSDDKGPEPEAIELVRLDGSVFALVGLERIGGVMVFDITDPNNPTYVNYVNNRNFAVSAESPEAGDLGVEDIRFISAINSPTGTPLVMTANEVSGTVTIFAVNEVPEQPMVIADSDKEFNLIPIGTYETGLFDESAAEIVAYDPVSQRAFSTNANDNSVDILDLSDPFTPTKIDSIDMSVYGGGVNSVALSNEIVAVAVEAEAVDAAGSVVFFDTDGNELNNVTVGVLPDMVIFSPDGTKVLTANEGEPNDEYTIDPEGSVSIIDITNGVANATVATADFTAFNGQEDMLKAQGIRIFGPGASAAQDFEPEYIAVLDDNATAYAILQENNAIAVIDIAEANITAVLPLGFKDHSKLGNGIDASNRSDGIEICTWPILGMYQPDAIHAVNIGGADYIVSANEGDARDYDGFSEETRVEDLTLDSLAYPNAASLQREERLGRLRTTDATGDTDGDGDIDQIYSYGARSFSIWAADGTLVFDSGDHFEQKLAELDPTNFNSTNDENDSFKNRSDDKGPEPEAVEIVKMGDDVFALIGLERIGGIMVYDITIPTAPTFVSYVNNRDFTVEDATLAMDLGIEDIKFIAASDSPTETPLVIAANEVSGTVTVYAVNEVPDPVATNDLNLEEFGFVFGPNPIADFATMNYNLPETANVNIAVFDVLGRPLQTIVSGRQSAGNYTQPVSLKDYPRGMYMIRVEINGLSNAMKVIKQ